MKNLLTFLGVLAVGSQLPLVANAHPNLLVAGDFESISSSNLTAYAATTTGVWATESAAITGAANGITPFGSKMLQLNHAGGGTAGQTNQVVYGPFPAGSVATFSVKFNTWRAADAFSPQTVAVSIMTDTGVALTGTRYTSPTVALDTDTSTWQTATVTVILPSDTNYLSAEILLWMFSGALPVGTPLAYADDAVLTVVPPSNSAPVISVPANITVNATSAAGAPVTFSATATSTESLEIFTRSTATAEPWQSYSTTFTSGVTGDFTLAFNVVSATGGDNSIFIDAVKVTSGASTLLADGFETPTLPNSSGVFADTGNTTLPVTLGSNWYFTNYGGIMRGPAAPNWGTIANGTPPEGSQHAVLRDVISKQTKMTFTGQISLVAGQTYTVSFDQASREVFGGALTYTVTLERPVSAPVTATPASGSTFPIGTTQVNLSATTNGGTTTGAFNVTVNTIPVTITLSNLTQTYDGSVKSASATTSPSGVTVNLGYTGAQLPPTNAGSYGVLASVSLPYSGTASGTLTIDKATSTTTTSGAGPFTYDGAAHAGGSGTVTGAGGLSTPATSLTYSGDQVNTGSYTVTAHYAGDANHLPSDGLPVTIAIGQATSTTTTIAGGPFTYDGTTHSGGSGTVSGAGVITGTTTVTYSGDQVNAGSYTVTAHYPGDANHTPSDGSPLTITINKASSTTTTAGDGPFTYDGTTHSGGSGTVAGAGTVTGGATVTYSGDQVNAGSYTVTAHYAGDANHTPSDGSPVTITINKASSTTTTAGDGPFTYDGSGHSGGSGTVAGAGLITGTATVTYSANADGTGVADQTNAGTYYVTAHYAGDANHTSSDGSAVAITINKANATVVVAPYSVTYNGQPHSATVTLITGVNGETGATVGTVTLSASHTNAGTYADSWSFAGAANYSDIAATAITDSIAKANATVVIASYGVTYDGNPHSAMITSITGVNNETGATVGTVTLPAAHTNAATYADSWSFAGSANYNNIMATAITDSIAKANASISVTGYHVTFDGNAHMATGSVVGVKGEPLGGLDLSGTTHTNAGTATDGWAFTDSTGNYNNATGAVSDSIAKADATISVTPYSVTYDGTAHTATGSASGVKGEPLSGLDVSATTHTNAGTTTDAWAFTDSTGNYNDATGFVSDSIAKAATKTALGAVPTIQAAGQPVTLTATVISLTSAVGSPDGTVTFHLGTAVLGSATLNAAGVAVLTTTAIPVGPQSITATYGGSVNFISSASNAVSILIYGYPTGGGAFVIGDGNAAVGAAVNFWGSQWEKNNSLSGGSSNASFKGFASGPTPPTVGATFTASPGNSAPSPASVPAYLGVIVTSKVTKSGPNISGTIIKLVVVKTNPGYAGDPGSPGTGTVVAVIQ